jgi:hypothetical protein
MTIAKDVNFEPVKRLTKDLRTASISLNPDEARYLVDMYYIIQEDRKRTDNQVRQSEAEPHSVLAWFADQNRMLESQVKAALDLYSRHHPVGQWAREVKGIGPVIAAGLLAHIDIAKCPTVGHIWRFAGLDPTQNWNKGEKRPWNAGLKVLCWKIGESFCKVSNGENPGFYGVKYRERKAYEIERNERGGTAAAAALALARKKYDKSTEAFKAYAAGKLPPAQIDRRAKRWAVKLFLSHLHEVWYEHHFGCKPPLPYPIAMMDHAHFIEAA